MDMTQMIRSTRKHTFNAPLSLSLFVRAQTVCSCAMSSLKWLSISLPALVARKIRLNSSKVRWLSRSPSSRSCACSKISRSSRSSFGRRLLSMCEQSCRMVKYSTFRSKRDTKPSALVSKKRKMRQTFFSSTFLASDAFARLRKRMSRESNCVTLAILAVRTKGVRRVDRATRPSLVPCSLRGFVGSAEKKNQVSPKMLPRATRSRRNAMLRKYLLTPQMSSRSSAAKRLKTTVLITMNGLSVSALPRYASRSGPKRVYTVSSRKKFAKRPLLTSLCMGRLTALQTWWDLRSDSCDTTEKNELILFMRGVPPLVVVCLMSSSSTQMMCLTKLDRTKCWWHSTTPLLSRTKNRCSRSLSQVTPLLVVQSSSDS
mmetsp:Transcript_106673/g.296903  ORF Transcript_106673/g.296903 Transcript_106673/m.296903 type:complete len:372 (+) Transcript_106673:1976-3091(+)